MADPCLPGAGLLSTTPLFTRILQPLGVWVGEWEGVRRAQTSF